MEDNKKSAALVLNSAVCELQQIADLCDMISLVGRGAAINPDSLCGVMNLFRDRLTAQAEVLEDIVLVS